jgi:plastocyanin
MPKRRFPSLIAALSLTAGAFTVAAAGQTPASAAAPALADPTAKIDNFTFGPTIVTGGVGTTVTWVNNDDISHTVVAIDKAFKSHVMDSDEKFSFTFTKPGEYSYFCSLHPHMVGKVVVKAS